MQPANSDEQQTGGIIHGSTMRNIIVRFSNFTKGGSATAQDKNKSHIEIGMFGRGVDGACFPHNSHFRAWGALANLGRLDEVPYVRNASIINNAVAQGWYLSATNRRAATSPYEGYLLSRAGLDGNVSVDVDGIAVDSASARNGLLFGRGGAQLSFRDAPVNFDGINFGSTIRFNLNSVFRNAGNGDYRPASGSQLIGTAAPVARTTAAGNGRTIPVDRAECFAGQLGGMRRGDLISVGNTECQVTETNVGRGTISCSGNITWDRGDAIFYRTGKGVMRDIGSRSVSDSAFIPVDDGKRPKPPALEIE
jgi:hypothetical protein